MVEKARFGEGASTRSGAGLSAGINLGKGLSGTPGQASKGEDHAELIERLMVESAASLDLIELLVARANRRLALVQRALERRAPHRELLAGHRVALI